MVRLLHSITAALGMASLAMAQVSAEHHWAFGPPSTASDLVCDKQLRGQYENLSIYAVSSDCGSLWDKGSNILPAENVYSNLIVVERQHLEGDRPQDRLDWRVAIHKSVDNFNGHEDYSQRDWTTTQEHQQSFLRKNSRGRSKLCRLVLLDDFIPAESSVDYRMLLGSNCRAEDITPLLTDVMPHTTEFLPVSTSGFIFTHTSLPPDHPIRIKSKRLRHRNSLQKIVNSVNAKKMEADVTWLSGEAEGSPFTSRSSTSRQSHDVAAWLKGQFEGYGCDNVDLMHYNRVFGPNVLCTIKGTRYPDELVILGAHHDSRGSFLNPRAPGADDDGSGTSMLLATARAIQEHNLRFERTVIIAAFSGEEQGLLGSAAYARLLREEGANVITMLQGDMLAYQKPGEPIQTAFPARHHTPELTNLLVNVTELYVPETLVGVTHACCSDHQSFFENGFPATAFFERNGPIADPKYHNSGDLVYREGYSFKELVANTKAMMASIFELANFKRPSSSFDHEEW